MGKIATTDNKIIEMFDKGTTLIQQRGWLPLNTLIMGTECLFWSTVLAHTVTKGSGWSYINIGLAAICLTLSFSRWKDAQGYWKNYRKCLELNAKVLYSRDKQLIIRMAILLIFTPFLLSDMTVFDLISMTSDITLISGVYLSCCRYLGPGDYARERSLSLSGLTQKG
jgi:hypothetical protein